MKRTTVGAVRATAITIVLLLLTACTDSGALTDPSPVESTTSSGLKISNLRARSGNLYEIANEGLQVGAKRFTDRGFRFESPLPARLRGLTFIRTAFDDRDANPDERSFLSFEVNRNVTVYVVHDDADPLPAWLRGGFDDTGLDLHDSSPHGSSLSVHRAWFPAGTVTLGSAASGDGSPVSMYTVLIESQSGGVDSSAPTVPANLSATAASSSAIDLSWSASSDDVGVDGYYVYRGGVRVADVPGPGFRDTGLAAGTEYTYTVAAYDAAGNVSSESAPARATTDTGADTQPPTVPTDLVATAASSSAIDLGWSASEDDVGVAGYFVYRNGSLVGDVSGTSYADTGLQAGTEYTYTVAAYDAAGNVSDRSAGTSATTAADDTRAPSVPTDLTATAVSSVAIDLSWSASQDDVGVAGYFVYRDGTQVGDVTGTTFHDTGLEVDTEYTYTVAAYDAAGNVSDPSAGASTRTTTPEDREAPSIPTGLSAIAASSSAIDLSWSASQDDVGVAGYYVYRGNTRIADVPGTTYRDSGLASGQSYLYTVAAYDAAGNVSNPSASASATTGTEEDTQAPTAPTNLSASAASSSAIDLSWTGSQDDVGVAGYYVYRGGSRVADVSGTSYRDGGLAASTSYTYTVAAYDAAGNVSGQSGSAGATTASDGDGSGGGLISNVRAKSGRFYQVVPTGFVAGRARYTDRDYTFQAPVPTSLQGLTYIRTANADKGAAPADRNFLTFDVARDVTVYVAHDDRAAVPAWLAERFTDTGMDVRDSDAISGTFSVYGAAFAAGSVTLGSNVANAGTQISMYSVIVAEGAGSGGGEDTRAPSIPTNLRAAAASSSAIDLSWSASSDDVGVAGYRVYRGNTPVAEVTGTTFRDTELEPATSYLYTVAAFDAAGNLSNRSASATATTDGDGDTQAPTVPTDLAATAASSSAIDLSWSASSDDVSVAGYHVYRGNTRVGDVSGTTFQDTGLEPATSYLYTVAAYDAAGNVSNRSASATATTDGAGDTQAPTVPTDLAATAASSSAIDLSWSASSDDVGVAGYYVYRTPGDTQVGDVSETGFRDTGLEAGTTYGYKVAAYDAAGNVSERSTAASATTDDAADTQPPTVPTSLRATAASSSAIDLSWSASSDDVGVAGYYVYRGNTQVGDVSGTSYRDGGLAASTSYTYTVAAYDAAGNVSNRSASASATTGSDGEASSGRLYEVWERAVENGKSYGNPYDFRQIELRATFEAPSGRTYDWFGFHDGNGSGGDNGTVWKLRFAPDEVGTWSYTYRWSDGTPGGSGTIAVSDGGAPGPLRVASDRSWFFENTRGRPFDARGYSLHQYINGKYGRSRFSPAEVDDLIDKIRRKAADRDYNLLMMLWPIQTDRVGNHFWQGTDFTRFDVSVWALLERVFEVAANRRVYVFPFAGLVDQLSARPTSDAELRVYLRYLAARLGPYWNVLGYSITWEYQDIYNDGQADWIMDILQAHLSRLPVPPLLSVHDHSDNTFRDWLDFSMRQQQSRTVFDGNLHGGGKQGGVGSAFLDAPILGSEDVWEYQNGDYGQPRNGTEVRRGAWGVQMAGVMPVYSEVGLSPARAPAGGQSNFSGEGERYVRLMYDFFFANTRYRRYQILNGRVSASQRQIASGIPGREYLVYDENGGTVAIDLSGDGGLTFQATWFNPVTGASAAAGSVAGGSTVSLTSPWSGDSVLLLRR